MKAILALAFTVLITVAEEPQPPAPKGHPRFEQMLKRPWRSFSLTTASWLGDYWNYGPGILLQKAPDERIIITWIPGPEAHSLPMVSKMISNAEGEVLRTKLSEVFLAALGETAEVDKMTEDEVHAFIAKTNHRPPYFMLVCRVAGLDAKTEEMETKVDTSDLKGMKGAYFDFARIELTLRPENQANKPQVPTGDSAPR